jgi:hypothetical protein
MGSSTAVKPSSRRPRLGDLVGVRMSGRLVSATVIEPVGGSGGTGGQLLRVKLGDPLNPDAPEFYIPLTWLEPLDP